MANPLGLGGSGLPLRQGNAALGTGSVPPAAARSQQGNAAMGTGSVPPAAARSQQGTAALGTDSVPPAAARSQEGPAAMGTGSVPPRRYLVFLISIPGTMENPTGDTGTATRATAPAPSPPPRFASVQRIGDMIHSTGLHIGRWYAPLAHARDFFDQVGKFVPNKELKTACPSLLVRAATACKLIGAEVGNITMCIQGAAGVCSFVGSAIRRLNQALPEAPVDPQTVYFTSIAELQSLVSNWKQSERPIVIDVDLSSTVTFAKQVEHFLKNQGDEMIGLMENSPNYKARLAQYRKGLELPQKTKGMKDILIDQYSRTPSAPAANCGQPTSSVTGGQPSSSASTTHHASL